MKDVCTRCGSVMTAADVVRAGNSQHSDGNAVCRDCTYNPVPTGQRPDDAGVR